MTTFYIFTTRGLNTECSCLCVCVCVCLCVCAYVCKLVWAAHARNYSLCCTSKSLRNGLNKLACILRKLNRKNKGQLCLQSYCHADCMHMFHQTSPQSDCVCICSIKHHHNLTVFAYVPSNITTIWLCLHMFHQTPPQSELARTVYTYIHIVYRSALLVLHGPLFARSLL
jgi:hypothetical protein